MLSELYIENIAVIEKTQITLEKGLNVLTGETGAGKSIVIDAINAVLGQRTSREIIRTGTEKAFVSAVFTSLSQKAADKVGELGYELEDGELIIQREIRLEGKGSCRINGRPAPVSALKELGQTFINIHGQHESYELLSPELHITYLDNMGGLSALLSRYQAAFSEMNDIKGKLGKAKMDDAEKARRIDLLQYQIDELSAANLKPNEQEELSEQKAFYLNSEKISDAVFSARTAIGGNEEREGALQLLEAASQQLSGIVEYFPGIEELSQRLQGLVYDLDDCAAELRDNFSDLETDPQALEDIEARLDTIYKLSRKYGPTIEEMLDYLDKSREELMHIERSEEEYLALQRVYENAQKKAQALANELSKERGLMATQFADRVKEELRFLDMPGVQFTVEKKECPLNQFGCDDVQFLISTNPGEPAKPIAKIASGGELSRMMLAIKNVLADKDEIDTLIFDEVDTGVSGSAAQKIGLKLRSVAEHRQVICVTHLAQIASLADSHLLIEKKVKEGRTFTEVEKLSFEGRKRELARIIGGVKITGLTLENAAEMLRLAGVSGEKA